MKKILLFISVLLIIVFGYFFYQSRLSLVKKSLIQKQNLTVFLKLSGQKDFIKQEIDVNMTALDLIKEKIKIVTKGEGVDAYVVEINGKLAEDSKKEFWAFYVNGKQATVGAGSYKLKEGDRIEWRIETY